MWTLETILLAKILYQTKFSLLQGSVLCVYCMSDEKHCFNTLSNQDILRVVNDIDVSKVTPSQNIPTKILKENIDLYIVVVRSIFNQSTSECTFPNRLKLSDVAPSHKGDVTEKTTIGLLVYYLPYQKCVRSYITVRLASIWNVIFPNSYVDLED